MSVPTRIETATASNYACDTLLSKNNDSTLGFAGKGVVDDTSAYQATPYLVNQADDVNPVCPGTVTFPDGISVPGISSTLAATQLTLAVGVSQSLLPFFPANFNRACIVTLYPTVGANDPLLVSSSGSVNNTGATPSVRGFGATQIAGVAGMAQGLVPTTGILYSQIVNNGSNTDIDAVYYGTGGATPATVVFNVYITPLAMSSTV